MPNRYICSVFEDMRQCHKHRNYSYLNGLIEEAQVLASRMEAAIVNKKDMEHYAELRSTLRKEVKALQKQREKLGGEKADKYI